MKNQIQRKLVYLLIILEFFTLCVAGYFWYRYTKLSKQSPTPRPTITQAQSPLSTTNLNTLYSSQFGFTLKYPNDWSYYKNASNKLLKLPYVPNLSPQNETLIKANGCAIHFGFGGAGGPSNNMQSQTVSLGSLNYTKRTWLIKGKPVFASYYYDEATSAVKKFELLFTWISNTNSDLCQKEIDQILSTFEFSK